MKSAWEIVATLDFADDRNDPCGNYPSVETLIVVADGLASAMSAVEKYCAARELAVLSFTSAKRLSTARDPIVVLNTDGVVQ